MSEAFAPIAASLAAGVRAYLERQGTPGGPRRHDRTVATNSSLLEDRAEDLLGPLRRRGVDSLEGVRLLDVGAGFGGLAALFAHRGARVTAVDPKPAFTDVLRAVAAEHGLAVEVVTGAMQDARLPPVAFDVVVVNNSLCYLVEPAARRRALAHLRAAAAPGAVLVLRDLNAWHPLDQFTRLPALGLLPPAAAQAAADRAGRRRPLVRTATPLGLRRLVREGGWRDARVDLGGEPAWRRAAAALASHVVVTARA